MRPLNECFHPTRVGGKHSYAVETPGAGRRLGCRDVGFSGGDHAGSATRVADAVADGRLRFFLACGARFDLEEPDVFAAVRSVCTQVPSSEWGGDGLSGVYDCRGKANALLGPA